MNFPAFLAAAQDLLTIESTVDRPAELKRALEFVINYIGPSFTVERFESNGKPSALLYTARTRPAEFRVILNAHLDVVPATPSQFRPHVTDDQLFARGAADMKVSALALAHAFKDLASNLPYPLALQLVTDEEIGGRHGTGYQVGQGVRAQFVIVGEHTALDIVAQAKGIINATVRVTGQAAHSAYPWRGANALTKLTAGLDRLLKAYPVPAAEAWATTITALDITTPNRTWNQLPDSAELRLDIRYPATQRRLAGRTKAEIAVHLADFFGPPATITISHLDAPTHTPASHPDIRHLQAAARAQSLGGHVIHKHGGFDGRYYAPLGIPAVAFGIGGSGPHGPHESADLTTIAPYYEALRNFLRGIS
jgi:succinyl-diaminopimelate desuccinylase